MGDKENTSHKNQQSEKIANSPLPPAPALPAPDPEQPHRDNVHRSADTDPPETDPWFRNPDWHMVWLTAAIFVVGIGTAWIFYRQFREMSKQSEILNQQAQQAARDSVEAAQKVEKQIELTGKQATAAVASAKAAKIAADAAKQSAEISVRQVRAYVVLSDEDIRFTNGKMIVNVHYIDTGQSPALDVMTERDHIIDTDPFPKVYRFKRPATAARHSTSVLPPGHPNTFTFAIPVSDDEWTRISQNIDGLVIFGSIFYTDIFKKRHETQFCVFPINTIGTGSWAFCPGEYNKMYDEQ